METKEKNTRGSAFVQHVLSRLPVDPAFGAALRRADNPATEYHAWEILTPWCNLENRWEQQPFALIGAALARAKPARDGNQSIGMALAASFQDGSKSENAKAKLRRLLACTSVEEACRILRPMLSFIAAQGTTNLSYAGLLDDLLFFGDRIRQRWTMDFFGRGRPE